MDLSPMRVIVSKQQKMGWILTYVKKIFGNNAFFKVFPKCAVKEHLIF